MEVDFVLGAGKVAIEAKGKERITSRDIQGLLSFKQDFQEVERLIVVCLEKRMRMAGQGVDIVPYQDFIRLLWSGKWTQDL